MASIVCAKILHYFENYNYGASLLMIISMRKAFCDLTLDLKSGDTETWETFRISDSCEGVHRTFIYFDDMSHLDIYWDRTFIRHSRVVTILLIYTTWKYNFNSK